MARSRTLRALPLTAVPLAVLLMAALPLATIAAADPPAPVAPGVEEVVAGALAAAPTVAALRSRLEAARERVAPAGAFPDPTLGLQLQAMGLPKIGPMSTATIGVTQEFPFPGKRKARREAARSDAQASAAELDGLRREVAAQARTLYAQVYALDRERRALEASGDLLDLLAATVSTRYAAGQSDQEALVKVQLEATRVRERQDDLAAERAALVASLNRLLDRPGDEPLGETRDLPAVAVSTPPSAEEAVAGVPDVAARESAVRVAEERLRAARLDRYPDFTAGLGGGVGEDLNGGTMPVVMGQFGMTLPLWQRTKYQPLVRAADADLAAARQDLRAAQAAARADLARLAAQAERDRRQVERSREAVIPQSRAAFDAARASYLAGRGDFSTVIDDFRMSLDARTQLARREADLFATWAAVQALVAPVPEPVAKGDARE